MQRALRGQGLWSSILRCVRLEGPCLRPRRLGAVGQRAPPCRCQVGSGTGEGASHGGSWDHPRSWDPWPGSSGGDSEQRALGPVATLSRCFLRTYCMPGDTQMKVNRQKHTSYFSPTR